MILKTIKSTKRQKNTELIFFYIYFELHEIHNHDLNEVHEILLHANGSNSVTKDDNFILDIGLFNFLHPHFICTNLSSTSIRPQIGDKKKIKQQKINICTITK